MDAARKAARAGSGPLQPWERMVASCSGAILTSLLMTPLDVAKVRLQAQSPTPEVCRGATPASCSGCTHYTYNNGLMETVRPKASARHMFSPSGTTPYLNGTWDGLRKIVRYEGVGSLYKGLAPTLVLSVPATMLYFTLYDELRPALAGAGWGAPLVAGALARTVAVSVISPLELVRTQMQAASGRESRVSIAAALRANVASGGVASLWRGLAPSLYRDVPFSAVYWMGYERVRARVAAAVDGHIGESAAVFVAAFAGGSASGAVAACLTHPFDVLKTRQQIEAHTPGAQPSVGTLRLLRQIVARESVLSLYTGLLARLAKIAPACAIMISSYELGKLVFRRVHDDDVYLAGGIDGIDES